MDVGRARWCFLAAVVVACVLLGVAQPCLARYTWSGDNPYSDVAGDPYSGWAYPYVESMRQAKVVVGYRYSSSNWKFKPRDNASRSWWGMCLMEILGTLEDYSYRIGNTDWYWDGRRWFRPYANDMLATGLIPYQTFQDGDIRRDEAFSWSVRAMGLRPVAQMMSESEINYWLDRFSDGWMTAPQYRADMALCVKLGLAKGYPDGTLRPADYLLREQGAVLASRLLSVVLEATPVIFSPPDGGRVAFTARTCGGGSVLSWKLEIGPASGAWTVLRSWSGSGLPGTLASWDGRDSSGVPCAAGWYLAQLTGTYRTVVGEQIGYHSIRRFALDMSPPVVVGSPTGYVGREGVAVAVSVSDDIGVASAEYAWSSSADRADAWQPVAGSRVVQDSEGAWYLHLRATDLAGKVTRLVLGPYCIDRTPPVVRVEPPTLMTGVRAIAAVVRASDNLSGVSSQAYSWSPDPGEPQGWERIDSGAVVWQTPGVWYLHVRASDVAGNTAHLVAGPYRIVPAEPLPVEPPAPPEEPPDWWTPPWYRSWYDSW